MSATDRNIRDLAEAVANASYAVGWDGLSKQGQATECMRAGAVLRTDWFATHVAEATQAAERALVERAAWEVQRVINHWSAVPADVLAEREPELADLRACRDRIAALAADPSPSEERAGDFLTPTMSRAECQCPNDCDCEGRFACEAEPRGTSAPAGTWVCELVVGHPGGHQCRNHRWVDRCPPSPSEGGAEERDWLNCCGARAEHFTHCPAARPVPTEEPS